MIVLMVWFAMLFPSAVSHAHEWQEVTILPGQATFFIDVDSIHYNVYLSALHGDTSNGIYHKRQICYHRKAVFMEEYVREMARKNKRYATATEEDMLLQVDLDTARQTVLSREVKDAKGKVLIFEDGTSYEVTQLQKGWMGYALMEYVEGYSKNYPSKVMEQTEAIWKSALAEAPGKAMLVR